MHERPRRACVCVSATLRGARSPQRMATPLGIVLQLTAGTSLPLHLLRPVYTGRKLPLSHTLARMRALTQEYAAKSECVRACAHARPKRRARATLRPPSCLSSLWLVGACLITVPPPPQKNALPSSKRARTHNTRLCVHAHMCHLARRARQEQR